MEARGHAADEDPLDASWSRAARLALRLLDVPLVVMVAPGAGEQRVRAYPAGVDDDWPAGLPRTVRDLARQVAGTGEPLWLDDLSRTPVGAEREGARGAFAGVPLRDGTGGAGALCVADLRGRAWGPPDQAALQDLAELAAAPLRTGDHASARESGHRQEPAHEHLREIADGFAAVVEASPLPILAIDREGRIELWSPAAERMFGWTQEEVLRRPSPIVPESERERYLRLRERALAGERLIGVEVRRVRRDGSAIDVSFSTAPLTNPAGEVYGSIIILDDITERRRAEERLRFLETAGRVLGGLFEYEDRLESLARLAVPALGDVCVIDLLRDDGTVTRAKAVHVDPRREELLRVPDAPLDDGPLARVVGGDAVLAPVMTDEALGLLARGAPADEVRGLGVRSLLSVPLQAHGRNLGVLTLASAGSGRQYGDDDLSLAREMAGRAALLLDNSRLYREAQQSTRAREEILAVVSHELRSPLQAITVLVDTLLQWLPPEAWRDRERRQLESVLHVSRQMSRLVQDLLDVTRIEAGHFSVRPAREALGGIVDEAMQILRPLAARERVRLDVRVSDRASALMADRQRVIQVLGNVVGNAIQASPDGGVVRVEAAETGAEVVFQVSDMGPGIPREELPHLFRRFWKPDRGGRLGPGLGLAIARGIVEAHGGRIGVDTSPRGSTFWFTLPAAGATSEAGAEEAYDAVVLLPAREPRPEPAAERDRNDAAREQAAAERQARFSEGVGRHGAGTPDGEGELVHRLREQVANAVHLGHIEPGDRLPSIRDVSRRFGVTTYAAVHAYEALAAEGLVEKRGRSGMYVAQQDTTGQGLLGETALWLVDVLAGAWEHQIKVPHVPDLVRRWTAGVHLRAACVESDGDTLTALCADVANHFGMEARPVRPAELAGDGAARRDAPHPLHDTDVLVTTAYHAAEARRTAEALGKPLLVAGLNPEHVRVVEERLRRGDLTVVCTDERFGERVRAMRGGLYAPRLRVVLADDHAAVAALDPADPVLLTRAAHERLDGTELRPLVPLSPFISPSSARTLTELLVRFNVEARRV
ncbi:MAG TPA: ATP-binding protein [Longimicrobium sp.]|nr:ATP-binding protein [Longimicrobium sp.]